MKSEEKITTGPNDRPRNEPIGQSGAGLPDDTSQPIEASDAEIKKMREKLGLGPEEAAEDNSGGATGKDAG